MRSIKLTLLAFATLLTLSSMAQDSTGKKTSVGNQQKEKATYTCSMHPAVVSGQAGKCPKCGMDLVKSTAASTKTYTCPMHAGVKSKKAGKCPKCKMELVESKG